MKSVIMPKAAARATFQTCADSLQDKELYERLCSVIDKIEIAETGYKEQAEKAALFTIAGTTTVSGCVTAKEMTKLYDQTFVKSRKTRSIYNALKMAPIHGICPYCGQRVISTLDHYLAKSKYPALAVTPINLVPSCADCNKAKADTQPSRASDQTLHPYFDKVDDEVWLVANLQEISPPALVFFGAPPVTWDDVKRERVLTHFRAFGLGPLYSAHAAEELQNINHSLMLIADRGGTNGIRSYLIEQAESRQAVAKNSWQSAMYVALGKSDWFCQGGHKAISTISTTA